MQVSQNRRRRRRQREDPRKQVKNQNHLGDGETETSEPSRKKSRVDKEAKQRLDALKLQTDMVHMSQKWTSRIKTLNIEVTASAQACQDFPHLVPFLENICYCFRYPTMLYIYIYITFICIRITWVLSISL